MSTRAPAEARRGWKSICKDGRKTIWGNAQMTPTPTPHPFPACFGVEMGKQSCGVYLLREESRVC